MTKREVFLDLPAGARESMPEYRSWSNMVQRCHNPKNESYPDYGGRGIHVCDDWRNDFTTFFAHVGKRPTSKHTIDRINTNGQYEPGNVRWCTRKEQNRNKRNNHRITFNGETMTMTEWGEKTGIGRSAIKTRLKRGWSIGDALTKPIATEVWNKLGHPAGAWGVGKRPAVCLAHGGTERRHFANGLCSACFTRKARKTDPAKYRNGPRSL